MGVGGWVTRRSERLIVDDVAMSAKGFADVECLRQLYHNVNVGCVLVLLLLWSCGPHCGAMLVFFSLLIQR